jgi:hypothetical protein
MARNDHFSAFASTYATFRPTYPADLFVWLAAHAPSTAHAWDCATGNGQAAISLAAHFDRITATDVSAAMIAAASPRPKITYTVASAETASLESQSVDLITVAQALHWFDLTQFWPLCQRIIKPGGLLAVWGYLLPQVTPGVDRLVGIYHDETVGPYWPSDRQPLLDGYASISPPASPIATPPFAMRAEWTVVQLIGLLDSWSATHRARAATASDPLAPLVASLKSAWGAPALRPISWPLVLRAFRF